MKRLVTEPELIALGKSLGGALEPGEVVWLEGEMGAGKTTLVRAMASGLGVRQGATSPTYSLVHRYQGAGGPVYHVDCYRLRRSDEARDLDWEGMTGAAALLIEWPERAGEWALPPTRRIRLAHAVDESQRWIEVS
jgi:tRNA threonylcarbamoyladenosine biosynthesis protein TsaE